MPETEAFAQSLDKNRDDISALTSNMAALTEIVKAQGKRQDDAIGEIKTAVQSIAKLDEKVSTMTLLQNQVSDLKTDNATFKANMDEVKEWKARMIGAGGAIKEGGDLIWKVLAVVGPILVFIADHFTRFGVAVGG